MNAAGVLLTGGGPANDGAQRDERGFRGLGLGGLKSLIQSGGVLLVGPIFAEPVDALNVPAVGLVAGQDVLVESNGGVVLDRDVVVVPDDGEVAKFLGASQRGGFGGHTFFEAAVAGDDVHVVVEDRLAERGVGIEQAVDAAGIHGEADGGGDACAKRTGRDLNALGVAVFGVARCQGAGGAQLLDVVELEAEACQVELDVLGERRVTSGEDETVTADPSRIGRIDVHDLVVEEVRGGCERNGGAGVSGSGLLDGVCREELCGLHSCIINMVPLKCHVGLQPYIGPNIGERKWLPGHILAKMYERA